MFSKFEGLVGINYPTGGTPVNKPDRSIMMINIKISKKGALAEFECFVHYMIDK